MPGLYIQWHITDACNLRCTHCYQEGYSVKTGFGLEGLKKTADAIAAAAKKLRTKAVINLTGGEPFLKNELIPLCEYLNSLKEIKEFIIISNGIPITDHKLFALERFKKLYEIKVSLEGASAAVNDSIRGKGSFAEAVKGLKMIANHGFIPTIMFTAMKSNFRELPLLAVLAKELDADGIIVERFIPMGNGAAIKKEVLARGEWRELVSSVLALSREKIAMDEIYDWRAFWIRIPRGGKVKIYGANCNISKRNFCVMPDGSVYPCRRFGLKIGNILETPLYEIMESKTLKEILNGPKKGKCRGCEIIDCRGCPALAYHICGDYLGEDSQCYKG